MMLDDEALAENDRFPLAADCQQVCTVPASSEYVDRRLTFMPLLLLIVCVNVCLETFMHASGHNVIMCIYSE